MEERLGDEFDAIVVSVMRFGLFVELEEIFVEGLCRSNRSPTSGLSIARTSKR